MTDERYPVEELDSEYDDDGTMPSNVEQLRQEVVGHRIVSAEKAKRSGSYNYWGSMEGLRLTLDNGKQVFLCDTSDCCAYTELEQFLLYPDMVDHVITGVGTENGYSKWHIYADMGDVLELTVGWSSGNPFYYGYGFDIVVEEA
jgi:hypothetical protein